MFKRFKNFKGMAVLLAVTMAMSSVSVVTYAKEVKSDAEVFEDTSSDNSNVSEEAADNFTINNIVSTQSDRAANEVTDEIMAKINDTLELRQKINQGRAYGSTWTNESGQNGYLIDLTYNSSGLVSHWANTEDKDQLHDNLNIHATYDEATNILKITQSVNEKPVAEDPDYVAYSADRILDIARVFSALQNASLMANVTPQTELEFEEGVTEIGEDYANALESCGLAVIKVTCPESCTVFNERAFYHLPYSNEQTQVKFELKSNKITDIKEYAFFIKHTCKKMPFPIIYVPEQTEHITIGTRGIRDAQWFTGKLTGVTKELGSDLNYKVDGKIYASCFDNVTLGKCAIGVPVAILGESVVDGTTDGHHWLADGGHGFSLNGNNYEIIIYSGRNPFHGTGTNAFKIDAQSAIYFYPAAYADSYSDTRIYNGISYAYSGSLDDLCENLDTYIDKALAESDENGENGDDSNNPVDYTSGETVSSDTGYQTTTVSSVQYTGKKIKINDAISATTPDGMEFTGKELKVKYKNNKNVGTATYVIKGIKSKRADKALKTEIKNEYASQTFSFEIVARNLNSDNIEIKTKKDGSIKTVKWVNGKKKKTVPKKMWSLDGSKLTFSGNFTGTVDVSQYTGTVSGNSAT